MANNLKISELPYASRIDDEALVVLVQDHSNKVVTVSELSDKINERQNHTIDSLWHELRRVTGAETVKALTNSVANHEYRIDGIERLNGKQDAHLQTLTSALQDVSLKQSQHSSDIRLLQTATTENRRSLAYLNCRVDGVIEDSSAYFNQISKLVENLAKLSYTHDEDIAYTHQYIADTKDSCYAYASTYIDLAQANSYAYTSYEVANNWAYTYSAYAYMATYAHFSSKEYWGKITDTSQLYTGLSNLDSTSSSDDKKTDTTTTCKPGCDC